MALHGIKNVQLSKSAFYALSSRVETKTSLPHPVSLTNKQTHPFSFSQTCSLPNEPETAIHDHPHAPSALGLDFQRRRHRWMHCPIEHFAHDPFDDLSSCPSLTVEVKCGLSGGDPRRDARGDARRPPTRVMAMPMARLLVAFWMACTWKGTCGVDEKMEKAMERLAFGSCNDQDEAQPLWTAVQDQRPDLFLFLGDNVYADRKVDGKWIAPTLKELKRCYDKQKGHPEYEKLVRNTPVRGMYDDHDGCLNDFGQGTCADLYERQKLMWDFFDEPEQSVKRKRKGVYSSLEVGPKGKKVKIILLDTRSFRDPLVPGLEGSTGDVLGEEQWKWLEEELRESDANVHLIGSSIQVIPYMHAYLEPLLQVESWNRFPKARERLFGLLRQLEVSGVIFLSGDVHYAEISQAPVGCALSYPLFDFTSSGMTHTALDESPLSSIFPSYAPDWVFPQQFKWPRFARKNFGSVDFFWNDEDPGESIVQMQAFGLEGHTKVFKRVRVKELQAQPWTPRSDCPSEADLPPTQRRRLLIVVFTSLMLHWILATALSIVFMYKFRCYKLGSHVLSRLAGARGYHFSMYYAKAEEKIH